MLLGEITHHLRANEKRTKLLKVCFLLRLQNYNSILRRPKQERKSSGKRARLSPHVLALDGALVGELETVQKAVQEVRARRD